MKGGKEIRSARAYELDSHYGESSMDLWRNHGIQISLSDFTKALPGKSDKFNLLICNPPYVRHHHIPAQEKRRLRNLSERIS